MMISQKLKMLNRIRPSIDPWGYIDNDWPPSRLHATDDHSLALDIQPVFNSPHCLLIQLIHQQFFYKDLMEDSVKGLTEV